VKRAAIIAAAALVLLALGAAIGRWSAPARTEDRIVLDERESVVYLRRAEVVTVTATKRTTATVTRWEYLPGRTVVVREERENEESKGETKAKAEEAGAREREQHIESVHLVEAERPRLMLGAHARLQLDGRIGWGPQAAVRVVGPVVATAAVDVPGRALMLGVGVWW